MKSARGVAMRNNRKTIVTVSVWLRLWIHSSRSSWFRLLFTRRKSWSDVCYLSEARDTVDESESNLLTQIFAWPGGQPTGARAAFLMKRNHRERGKRNGDPETRRRNHLESFAKVSLPRCWWGNARFIYVLGFIVDESRDHLEYILRCEDFD